LGKIIGTGYTEHLCFQVLGLSRSGLFQIAAASYKGAEYGVVMRCGALTDPTTSTGGMQNATP